MRPFIKARLSDTIEAHEAAAIVEAWRKLRTMSQHLPRAIRLYAALLQGDDSVLAEYFPFVTRIATTRPAMLQQPARQLGRPAPVVALVEQSDQDKIQEAADLGFDGLDFGTD